MRSRRHRTALAALAVCAGIGTATAGCALTDRVINHPMPASLSPTPTGSPQAQAAQVAWALLHTFDGLAGASVSTYPPSPGPSASASAPSDPSAGVLNAQWTVNAASGTAFTAAEARMPRWAAVGTQEPVKADGRNSRTVQETGDASLAQETVSVTTVPLASDRSTLQVSVEVYWRPPRSAAETLPDSPELIVSEQLATPLPASASQARTATLTDPAIISAIGSQIDSLPTEPEFPAEFCPIITARTTGGTVTLEFRNAAGNRTLAEVQMTVAPSAVCGGWVQVTVGGAVQPRLDDDAQPGLASTILGQAGLFAPSPS
jgi:hypothetical protein